MIVNLFKEELDKDFLVPDKLGLLVAEVDLEFAVEFLVLDLDLGRGVKLAGDISMVELIKDDFEGCEGWGVVNTLN